MMISQLHSPNFRIIRFFGRLTYSKITRLRRTLHRPECKTLSCAPFCDFAPGSGLRPAQPLARRTVQVDAQKLRLSGRRLALQHADQRPPAT